MIALTLFLILGAAAAFYVVLRRIAFLEEELRRVESLIAARDHAAPETPARRPEFSTPPAPAIEAPSRVAEAQPEHEPARTGVEPRPLPQFSLETLIGGRLPIWIGGAALVLAGFFLVRYSIESGLLGPGTRTVLAALFGAALIAGSEVVRRLRATADDPRVAQTLAGAGIASLYGTLYMAAALYHLIAPPAAFLFVLLITGGALALALRHGPPTAAMALIGGFAAPLVAGFDAAGIGPLLVYLALFTAALFGLAIHRGWVWLALAACASGFAWVNFLITMLVAREGDLSAVGAFTMLLAIGASAALPATGAGNRWLRLAPLVAGCLQLAILAPALDFGWLAWSLYLTLAAAALFLAWRDTVYLPGALAACALLLVLEMLAIDLRAPNFTPVAAILATGLFAMPGHALARRHPLWAGIALLGTAGPLLIGHLRAPELLSAMQWGWIELAAAAAVFGLAWRSRADGTHSLLVPATALAAFLAGLGLGQFVPGDWLALPLSCIAAALAWWAHKIRAPRLYALPAYPLAAALIAAALPLGALSELILASLSGERLTYALLPALPELLRELALPVALAAALLLDPAQFGRVRRVASLFAVTLGVLLLYALAKQPLAIATLPRFETFGFVERALLTQACLAAGWLLLRRARAVTLGHVLLALGLFRILWFDLLLLTPLAEPQAVGPLPLLNAAVLHLALASFWLWTLPPRWRPGAALLALLAVLAAVRQAAHGNLLTGPIGTGENGGYSAAMLALALFWLWRGIAAGARDLRVFGLALLTGVTFKVFLIDAAALDGLLRILSFLGLGIALIGIGWAYGRFVGKGAAAPEPLT
ncbi:MULTISPECIES: DUF2339 domain-containing protein [unclassified Sphingomonas]|uniref:DUF2339 domain-containing protein n=1 Tax=Sphingomonas TaxID=13687 RepID=UPI000AD9ED39|nr:MULTISPECIES: DUF2339 domain-containing protein [unclassified Sphingomonas]